MLQNWNKINNYFYIGLNLGYKVIKNLNYKDKLIITTKNKVNDNVKKINKTFEKIKKYL